MRKRGLGNPPEVVAGVNAALDAYEKCWGRLDFDAMRRLWDDDEHDPIYLAEEHREVFVGYPVIEAYWAATREPLVRARVRTWDRLIKQIGDDLAVAFYQMRWMVELDPSGPMLVGAQVLPDGRRVPVGGDVRATAVFRRRGADWRFIHYVESPLGALTQLVSFHETWVDADFVDSSEDPDDPAGSTDREDKVNV